VCNVTNLALTGKELQYITDHADAEVSVTNTAFQSLIGSIKPECPKMKKVIVIGETDLDGDTISWDEMLKDVPTSFYSDHSVQPEDAAVLMYTSGTTALPKGVMLSHRNILAAGYSWMWAAGFTAKDRTLSGFPLFHANALVFSCIGSLSHGGSFVLLEKFTLTNLMDCARRYHVTHFNFAGPAMERMLQMPADPGDGENPVRIVHCAIGTPDMIGAWSKRFEIAVVMAYNLTECTIATCTPISGPNPIKFGSIGWVAPSAPYPTEVRIVDEKGNDVGTDVVGEVLVRGPAVMIGYYKDPQKTADTIKSGWLRTGDAAWRDKDDCLWFSDRLKDVLKIGGENVSSVEVDEAIASHPRVAEVAVVGIGEAAAGDQQLLASIVLRPGETAETVPPADVAQWCAKRCAKFKVPRFYDYRDSPLPRIGGVKISKKDVRLEKEDLTKGSYDLWQGKWL
jgi:crotonobetaine/carnitine-CoA ligase